MPARTGWTRDQLLIALRLYMRLPFGKLHAKNPEIVALAVGIGRTPAALAMKACNFAALDPNLNRKGLSGASAADRAIWAEFEANPTALALEAEEASARLGSVSEVEQVELPVFVMPVGPTDREAVVRVRRVQSFFRAAVLTSYEGRCALSGIAVPELLVASHIVPWGTSVERRADPTNGLCLNALFDRAFDRGFLAFDDSGRALLAKGFRESLEGAALSCDLVAVEGKCLRPPIRFAPDPAALAHHRETVYRG